MEVLDAIRLRRSVRSYADRPIPDRLCSNLLTALRFAPSACNFQPWRFILVRDPARRQQLAAAANNQKWMAQAPLIIVGCGVSDQAYKRMGGTRNSIDIDLAIALDHLTLAAVAEGLATCWIGAFDEQTVREILHVPADVHVVALMPVGYPASANLNRPVTEADRKPAVDVFADEQYPSAS